MITGRTQCRSCRTKLLLFPEPSDLLGLPLPFGVLVAAADVGARHAAVRGIELLEIGLKPAGKSNRGRQQTKRQREKGDT